jgi:RNA polymerase sigma-70 factor (ECF subfamily)
MGDAEDFRRLYRDQYPGIVRLAYLLVRSRPVAEELAQEAFLRLFSSPEDIGNPPGWLRTVVVRLASTWRARRAMEHQRLQLVSGLEHAQPVEIDETWDALGRLRQDRATVLVLRFYEDLPYRSIAVIVGCSAATVRSRVRRGLIDLRKELTRASQPQK